MYKPHVRVEFWNNRMFSLVSERKSGMLAAMFTAARNLSPGTPFISPGLMVENILHTDSYLQSQRLDEFGGKDYE